MVPEKPLCYVNLHDFAMITHKFTFPMIAVSVNERQLAKPVKAIALSNLIPIPVANSGPDIRGEPLWLMGVVLLVVHKGTCRRTG